MISVDAFDEFFTQAHGIAPFPWQRRLARQAVAGEWPSCIALPTAAGKTALIDIAVFALAAEARGAARRIFFIVDRRLVVDAASERATRLRSALLGAHPHSTLGKVAAALRRLAGPDASEPLQIGTLRGGLAKGETWARSPTQPAVFCSTVDQVGSSLLFRAYASRSKHNWPIRAALAANDALLIVDEAHLSGPFLQTLESIRHYRGMRSSAEPATPFHIIEMSATPRASVNVFRETDEDRAAGSVLHRRWSVSKPTRLIVAAGEGATEGNFSGLVEEMVKQAIRLRQEGANAVGVIANRVATARAIHSRLGPEAELMIGRSRPFDRDVLWKGIESRVKLGRPAGAPPVFLVATQCVEVGADLDFDAMVTEAASIDALEQRFGRLNRDGREIAGSAAIVAQKDQTASRYEDAVYGTALAETWRRLTKVSKKKGKIQLVDMGVDALRNAIPLGERDGLVTLRSSAPALLPAHLDQFCQTGPAPTVAPEPALFLHGPDAGPADVSIVWRADLNPRNTDEWVTNVERLPPQAAEMMAVPVWAVRRWLSDESDEDSMMTDVEGTRAANYEELGPRPVLHWKGSDGESEVVNRVAPGWTIVVPCAYGGADGWGWNPLSKASLRDVADVVALRRGVPTLRIEVAEGPGDLLSALRTAERVDEIRKALRGLAAASRDANLKETATTLAKAPRLRLFRRKPDEEGFRELVALSSGGGIEQESAASSYTVTVPLDQHLQSCAERAAGFAELAGLRGPLARTAVEAARLHDIGKADRRFQSWLRGGTPLESGVILLAKSGLNGRDRTGRDAARQRSGYPEGGRHELQSVAMLEGVIFDSQIDRDLLLHLIGSHHGRCRPFAPAVSDREPVQVRCHGFEAASDHELHTLDSGVSERFWRLTRRYGWWGLALLEAIVRLADQRQSEAEETASGKNKEEANAIGAD